ncbi:MAG: 6-carboxytetrahydropterin synthase [Acidobacteriota bacterium]
MSDTGEFTMVLAKENFKFSSAHFTVFDAEHAEPLHGHNYLVRVELKGHQLDGEGMLVDIDRVKKHVRTLCDRLDEQVLLPRDSRWVRVETADDGVEIVYGPRRYRLPVDDVTVLEVENVTIETLARLLWRRIAEGLGDHRCHEMTVEVGETAGQSCRYCERLVLPSS